MSTRFDPVTAGLQNLHDEVAPQRDGELADYIAPLAAVDPERFGIASRPVTLRLPAPVAQPDRAADF